MRLPDYIDTAGDDVCAKAFDVSLHTVLSWKYGKRQPRPEKAMEIERITRGMVTFRECFEPKAEAA